MKIPRNISGDQLAKLLDIYGYKVNRQVGSHIRLTTQKNGEHQLLFLCTKPFILVL